MICNELIIWQAAFTTKELNRQKGILHIIILYIIMIIPYLTAYQIIIIIIITKSLLDV